ncbi:hypothetical protein TEA_004264 [Camellia sinensis var. sinensis]|uniref:Uncharacterized protein n=1 Tax=Camellia sinensis var. sinensis TaxID=542762 RepID=A0A4S4D2U9_CAMSN|nr:hypothetical protein TEA_004264 [Camellia sinensis var. sinensis]
MYYVGGNSESVEQDLIHSYSMAYGGGGFAVSYPLAAELVRILDGCVDRYAALYGSDQKIGGCMSEIGVVVTKELGFHQVCFRVNTSPPHLVTVLGKYDHNEMYYVGGNSESVEQDLIHSYSMAYGGGGFAVSYPLAAELVRILDGCVDRYAALYGSDQKIGGCMSEIGVVVTKELGFHQVDVRGDPYGLLAAHPVAPLVSLHHLDYVQALFPGLTQIDSLKKLIQAYNLDPGRILQQSFCYDLSRNWSISVSWGYTVQLYPTLVLAKELETPFQTFVSWRSWSQEPFTFNTRVMSSDPCERPVIYFLDQVEEVKMGQTRTTYKRFLGESRKECGQEDYVPVLSVEFVTVLAATFQPDMWKKVRKLSIPTHFNFIHEGITTI